MAHKVKLRRRGERAGGANAAEQAAGDATTPETAANLARAEKLTPWVVGVIALLVYMGTMSPGMQMGDGTELAAAAYVLGVPHPTGYPLYMMLTKLWLVLTVGGEVITRTTLMNCVIMAAAAGLTSVIVKDLLRVVWRAAVSKQLLLMSALTGLLTAFLRFHWENAVVTEVYALQFLLTLIFVRIVQKMDLTGGPTRRSLIWLTVVFALAMAHHRLSVTLILPWVGVWVWAWRGRGQVGDGGQAEQWQRASKRGTGILPVHGERGEKTTQLHGQDARATFRLPWVWGILVLVAGAALYLYIPLRAAQEPPINWGNARTWSAFYNHVRGTEYLDRGLLKPGLGQEFDSSAAGKFIKLQTLQICSDVVSQLLPVKQNIVPGSPGSQKLFLISPFIVALIGAVILVGSLTKYFKAWKAGVRVVPIVIGAIALQNVAILYVYNIIDIRDYYLFPFWALFITFPLYNRFFEVSTPSWRMRLEHFAVVFLVFAIAFFNYPRCNRSNDISAEMLSATILPEDKAAMPSGSILITDDDAETFTTWYRQMVRKERLDVLNFAGNFVYMPWYRAFFTEEQIREFQIKLAPHVARSAGEYAQQLRTAIVDKNVASRPVFTSINDPAVLGVLAETYAVEPVDAVEIINPLFDEPTTNVLYRIKPKDQAAK